MKKGIVEEVDDLYIYVVFDDEFFAISLAAYTSTLLAITFSP